MSAPDGAPLRRHDPAAGAPRSSGAAPPSPGRTETWLADLGIAGFSRRRLAIVVGLVVIAWIGIAFGRQLGTASAAQARADALAAEVARRSAEVANLEAEVEQIQAPAYVRQQARAYGLGAPNEIPFTIDPKAPPLPPNAPGSAATRLGEAVTQPSPLDVWLTLLFGPDPGG